MIHLGDGVLWLEAQEILRDWFCAGDVICDPFDGSDTTGYAAMRLGLQCYSLELDPKMYNAGLLRHAQADLFGAAAP